MATDIPMVDAAPLNADLDADGKLDPPSVVEQWTAETLFNSQPMQKMLWSQKSRETFKDAEIDGKTFLKRGHIEDFWFRRCGLPIGPSAALAELAQTIKNMGKEESQVQSPPAPWDGKLPTPSSVEQWTEKELLDCILVKEILADGEVRAKFKEAKIDGKAFLLRGDDLHIWTAECHLPLGPSVKLADLAERIKGSASQAKRDERIKKLHSQIQNVSCEVSKYCNPNHKQLLPFPFLRLVPARFKLDDKRCFEFYGRSKFRELYEVARSMNLDQNPQYFFHGSLGAGKSHLLAALACLLMREGKVVVYIPDCNALLADPVGYFLTALELAYDSNEHLRSKLMDLRREGVDEGVALERLKYFCREAGGCDPAFFIVDQANALDDETVRGSHRFSNEWKKLVRRLLDASSASHLKLESSTANYKHAWTDSKRQKSEGRIGLYCGLDEKEMEALWTANGRKLTDQLDPKDPLQQLEKDYLEELTGRMPILLQALAAVQVEKSSEDTDVAVNDHASSNISGFPTRFTPLYNALFKSNEVETLIECMNGFWSNQEKFLPDDLQRKYWNAVLSCLACSVVDTSARELLDWRYFYVDDGNKRGHTTCGIVRLVAGALLRRVKNIDDFGDPVWLRKTEMSGKNPSVLGFHVEYLILRHIYRFGCSSAGPEFAKTGREKVFHEDMPPSLEPDFNGTILYRPASCNFPAVDGILVCRVEEGGKGNNAENKKRKTGNQKWNMKRKKEGNLEGSAEGNQKGDDEETKKAVVVGIQITIAGAHSDSEEDFFSRWEEWKDHMKCENIEFRFLWIVENRSAPEEEKVPAKTRKLRGRTIEVPQFTRYVKTVEEVDKVIGGSLKRARELARK